MNEQGDENSIGKQQRDQMLRLVSKGFYNELINYGVRKEESLRVASHLLDNLMAQEKKPAAPPAQRFAAGTSAPYELRRSPDRRAHAASGR